MKRLILIVICCVCCVILANCTPNKNNVLEYKGTIKNAEVTQDKKHIRIEWTELNYSNKTTDFNSKNTSNWTWLFVNNNHAPNEQMVSKLIAGKVLVINVEKKEKKITVQGVYLLD